jgi:hypothetical protein
MISRMLTLVLILGVGLTFTLPADTTRGIHLITEAGGAQGIAGVAGPAGSPGLAGAAGAQGIPGISGIPGAPGILDFSDFYDLVSTDVSIALNTALPFTQTGSTTGVIVPVSGSGGKQFYLPVIGTYLVLFQASVTEAAQLELTLATSPIATPALVANSTVGRATGSSQIVSISLVTTTTSNSVLSVISPSTNAGAILLTSGTPSGGTGSALSTHLVILRIQ